MRTLRWQTQRGIDKKNAGFAVKNAGFAVKYAGFAVKNAGLSLPLKRMLTKADS